MMYVGLILLIIILVGMLIWLATKYDKLLKDYQGEQIESHYGHRTDVAKIHELEAQLADLNNKCKLLRLVNEGLLRNNWELSLKLDTYVDLVSWVQEDCDDWLNVEIEVEENDWSNEQQEQHCEMDPK